MRTALTSLAAMVMVAATGAPAGSSGASGAGRLDGTFSGDGKALLGFGGGHDSVSGRDVLVLASGKVVVVAALTEGTTTVFGTARLRENGRPDPSFSANGRRTTTFTGQDVPRRVVSLGDGRILVAGSAGDAFGLVAYRSDGSLDPSFGAGGKVVTDVSDDADQVLDLRVGEDGTILAAGVAGDQFAIVRYLPTGVPDPTYGDGGVVVTTDGFDGDPTSARLQPDGKLVAVGTSPPDDLGIPGFAVARYDVDGSLDETFGGGDGRVTTRVPSRDASRAQAVIVDSQGRLLVGGSTFGEGDYRYVCLVRYAADGELDPAFGVDGIAVDLVEPYYSEIMALARQGDGRIVAAGWTDRESGGNALAVARYTGAGVLDPTFNGDGTTAVGFDEVDPAVAYAVMARGGRIVATGDRTDYPSARATGVVVRLRQ